MKVVHFAKRFSPISETFVYDYISELEEKKIDNYVITLRRENRKDRPFPKVTTLGWPSRWNPVRQWHFVQQWVSGEHGFNGARIISAWPQVRRRLEKTIRHVQPDVIHAHFGPAGALIAPLADRMDIPLVVTFYGYDISSAPKKDFWRKQYNSLWRMGSAFTVLSEDMRASARELGCPEEKISIVRLSRDLSNIGYSAPEGRVRNLLFVGRMVPKKAPLDAVKALEVAIERGAELSLEMIGNGALYEDVEEYLRESKLSGEVKLRGELPNDKVIERMYAADAFLLPSKTAENGNQEGTPTVLIEAQAAGLPCVSTTHAGIPEMIPAGINRDYLASEGDVGELASCLCKLGSQPTETVQQITERGRRHVESKFNIKKEVEIIKKIYVNNY